MNYNKSALDSISQALAPVIRAVGDVIMQVVGTASTIIRITQRSDDNFAGKNHDVFGDYNEFYESQLFNNATFKFPFTDIRLYNTINERNDIQTNGIELIEVLPIEMTVAFNRTTENDIVAFKIGDMIISTFFDEHNHIIPLIFTITRIKGSFFQKEIINRKYELAPHRGILETHLQQIVDSSIEGLKRSYRENDFKNPNCDPIIPPIDNSIKP